MQKNNALELAQRALTNVARSSLGLVAGFSGFGDSASTHPALEGLRASPLRRYPYLVFDVEPEDHLEVWRVLHAQRDIPAWMQEPKGP